MWSSWIDMREGRRLVERGLALPAERVSLRRAHALAALGDFSRFLGDFAAARRAFEESLTVHRELDMPPFFVAACLTGLADVALAQGDLRAARRLAEEGVRVRREELDSFRLARGLSTLVEVAMAEGDLAQAGELADEAVERCRVETPEHHFQARFIFHVGEIKRRRGDHAGALESFAESLRFGLARENALAVVESLESVAAIWGEYGDSERAARVAGAAERFRQESGIVPKRSLDWTPDRALPEWNEGRRMSLTEAAEYALASLD